jgi:uncharacterized protein YecE (DUF72 family)
LGRILIGTAGWTDKTLIDSGRFYPKDAKSSESRLQYYASPFPMVEVDTTYYGMPVEKTSGLWVSRTPDQFVFDIKAFSALTQHPTQPRMLPPEIRETLPAELSDKRSVYYKDLPPDIRDAIWDYFRAALTPLAKANKLGVVLFQFPPWFLPGHDSRGYIEEVKARMTGFTPAIEFRNPYWLLEDNLERTLGFLRGNKLPFVCVDEPQGTSASVPPVASCTGPYAIVRFHGHNREAWTKRGATVAEKYDYLYSLDELREWEPRIERLSAEADETHAIMNNCHDDKAVRNARDLAEILGKQLQPPDESHQERLI